MMSEVYARNLVGQVFSHFIAQWFREKTDQKVSLKLAAVAKGRQLFVLDRPSLLNKTRRL
jgi:hypothetical protein